MPTKQFKWIDRDTAARDILQLVYHAPPQIAERAVKLLKAIRSPTIIPELKAMFPDEEYDKKWRRQIYEVICATPGDFDFSEFESVISEVFGSYNFYSYVFRLLRHHPVNVTWILRDIENKRLHDQTFIYLMVAHHLPHLAVEPLLKLLLDHPEIFNFYIARYLHQINDPRTKDYLIAHKDQLIQSWLSYEYGEGLDRYWTRLNESKYWRTLLDHWPELWQAASTLTVEQLASLVQTETIHRQRLIYTRLLPYAPETACHLLLNLIDEKLIFLDLETAGLLHQYGDESVQAWLKVRWDELIYLCLVDNVGAGHHISKVRIIHILENWPELKIALFHQAPSMVEEYKQLKTQYESYHKFFDLISDDNIRRTPAWQEIEQQRKQRPPLETHIPNKEDNPLYDVRYFTTTSKAEIPQIAVKTYFLGIALDNIYSAERWLVKLLSQSDDKWPYEWISVFDGEQGIFVCDPVRFEAAYALRNRHTPQVWEMFVEALLTPKDVLGMITDQRFDQRLCNWISRMTDILSGIEPELPDEEIPLSARPWFRALVTQTQT